MKSLLRSIIYNIAAFHLASLIIPGLNYTGGLKTLFIAVIVLSVMNISIKPIINLLLLPINVLTLGMFRWVVNVLVLFLLILVVSNIQISSFIFPGIEFHGFIIPDIHVSNFWTLLISSVTISLVYTFLIWLCKES
jgi:putative membrane protein